MVEGQWASYYYLFENHKWQVGRKNRNVSLQNGWFCLYTVLITIIGFPNHCSSINGQIVPISCWCCCCCLFLSAAVTTGVFFFLLLLSVFCYCCSYWFRFLFSVFSADDDFCFFCYCRFLLSVFLFLLLLMFFIVPAVIMCIIFYYFLLFLDCYYYCFIFNNIDLGLGYLRNKIPSWSS